MCDGYRTEEGRSSDGANRDIQNCKRGRNFSRVSPTGRCFTAAEGSNARQIADTWRITCRPLSYLADLKSDSGVEQWQNAYNRDQGVPRESKFVAGRSRIISSPLSPASANWDIFPQPPRFPWKYRYSCGTHHMGEGNAQKCPTWGYFALPTPQEFLPLVLSLSSRDARPYDPTPFRLSPPPPNRPCSFPDSCRTMPLVGGFSRGSPVSPAPSYRCRSIFTSLTLIGSQDLAVKSRPNLFSHSIKLLRGPGLIPDGYAPWIFECGNPAGQCRWSAGFSRGYPLSPAFSFRRCSILTSLHPH
ncbi:hypothetical protein PR048_017051 [Dryococelus australis]|uniref:Uncharacterized protein n=1 Tax=Dryococelus australis TaxID=614101 RepID=A0ABQ9H8L4_9NEOP|nr:hypothetical protein PR048_017051 [Dryococelus australis]